MSDTIFLDKQPGDFEFVPREEVENGWIKHVHCDGARFHTLSWTTLGTKCSETKCILNKYYQDRQQRIDDLPHLEVYDEHN